MFGRYSDAYPLQWAERLQPSEGLYPNKLPTVPKLLDLPGELVIKHIGEPLEENQREDEVLELWRVRGSANRACRIPQPCLQHRDIKVLAVQRRHIA